MVQILEKARENLPAKQPKTKSKSAAPATKAARPPSTSYDEPEAPTKKEKSPVAEAGDTKAVAKGPGKTKAKGVSFL